MTAIPHQGVDLIVYGLQAPIFGVTISISSITSVRKWPVIGLLGKELIGQSVKPATISQEVLNVECLPFTMDHLLSVVYWTGQAGYSPRHPGILQYAEMLQSISVSNDLHLVGGVLSSWLISQRKEASVKQDAYPAWGKVCRRRVRMKGVFIEWVGYIVTPVRCIDRYPANIGEIRHRWIESPIPVGNPEGFGSLLILPALR